MLPSSEHRAKTNFGLFRAVTRLIANCALAGLSLATDKPEITSFAFDQGSQTLSFYAQSGGKECAYQVSSSSTNTTFDPPNTTSGTFGAAGGGHSWQITPGGSSPGEEHTFTIVVTNSNGDDTASKCLRVRNGITSSYGTCDSPVPTMQPRTIALMVVGLLVIAGTILHRRSSLQTVVTH
jgi:hypothetical protein